MEKRQSKSLFDFIDLTFFLLNIAAFSKANVYTREINKSFLVKLASMNINP